MGDEEAVQRGGVIEPELLIRMLRIKTNVQHDLIGAGTPGSIQVIRYILSTVPDKNARLPRFEIGPVDDRPRRTIRMVQCIGIYQIEAVGGPAAQQAKAARQQHLLPGFQVDDPDLLGDRVVARQPAAIR